MPRCPAVAVVVMLGAAMVPAVHGQGVRGRSHPGLTTGAGVMYGNLVGGDVRGTNAAAGYYAVVGLTLRHWQLGVGYDRARHTRDVATGDFVVSNLYVEPRLAFAAGARLTPYASARIGRSAASFDDVVGLTERASGYMAGIGAGVLWRLARVVQADAGAQYARFSHDYGTDDYAAAEKGARASVRLGLRVGRDR